MECIKCGFEWNENSGIKHLRNCPICGEKIIYGQNDSEEDNVIESLVGVINEMIRIKGDEILGNNKSVMEMFVNIAPKLKVEYVRLQMVINCGVWDRLYRGKNQNVKDQLHAIACSEGLMSRVGIQEDVAYELLADLCQCFKYDEMCISKIEEKKAHQGKTSLSDLSDYQKKRNKKPGKDDLIEWHKKGKEAEKLKEYELSYVWFKKAADFGYAPSQWELGNCYVNGFGVAPDYAEAVKWFRKAAIQGYIDGQNSLGYCYEYGKGVKRNRMEAAKWYRKAAEQNDEKGQERIGTYYEIGFGVIQDFTEAVKWYKRAAENGSVYALLRLGVCCEKGRGVQKNIKEAVVYYKKAAAKGSDGAKRYLERLMC